MKVFSLACMPNRAKNLDIILPSILRQADLIYLNLVQFEESNPYPQIINNNKIIVNKFSGKIGSQNRFFNYNNISETSYFFPIDDDILYPEDYSDRLISEMIKRDNKCICCVHASDYNLLINKKYMENRVVYHFRDPLEVTRKVICPGVGTSCFYKGSFTLDYSKFEHDNMSDCYICCFAAENQIPIYTVTRERNWLRNLNEYSTSIFGNNPNRRIDKMINEYKERILINYMSDNYEA